MARAAAGDLLLSELEHLSVVREPQRPLLAIVGGAKVSSKLGVLEALAQHADTICIGGAMSYTFLAARGEAVGASLVEADQLDGRAPGDARRGGARTAPAAAHRPRGRAADRAGRPEPRGASRSPTAGSASTSARGRRSATPAKRSDARTVFWNGPMGVFEIDAFARGTETLAKAVASSRGVTVVGGGDSLAAVHRLGVADRISFLSTGGGASLEFVEGLTLPGVAALER